MVVRKSMSRGNRQKIVCDEEEEEEEDSQNSDDVADAPLLEEDKYGRLICREKCRVYPHNSRISRQSVAEAFDDETPPSSLCSSEVLFSRRSSRETEPSPDTRRLESEVFIGGATAKGAEARIGTSGFVIYYQMPDDATVPFSLPLMLAYRSGRHQHYHFPISQRKVSDVTRKSMRLLYKVECGRLFGDLVDSTHQNPEFLSLETLVKHFETFAFSDVTNGRVEVFPVGIRLRKLENDTENETVFENMENKNKKKNKKRIVKKNEKIEEDESKSE